MVNSKRYDPTNTRFQKHTQAFVSGKTRKGHLNDDREAGDTFKAEGVLVRVDKNKINSNGWEVKIDNKTYYCTYGDNIVYLPPYTSTNKYYLPKSQCDVEVSIDKKSKIYTITRIKSDKKQPITLYDNMVKLEGSNTASITITENLVETQGAGIKSDGDIVINTESQEDLPDQISLTDLYIQVQELKDQLSDTNDI